MMLLGCYMTPGQSPDDATNCGLRDAVLPRQCRFASAAPRIERAYLAHLSLSELGTAMILSAAQPFRMQTRAALIATGQPFGMQARPIPVTTRCTIWMLLKGTSLFFGHILSIVLYGANKKVSRVDASRSIAVMANQEALCDRAKTEFVGDAMGRRHTAAPPDLTIALSSFARRPQPTAIRPGALVYFGPEAFRKCSAHSILLKGSPPQASGYCLGNTRLAFGEHDKKEPLFASRYLDNTQYSTVWVAGQVA
jgi:hypothetical protein